MGYSVVRVDFYFHGIQVVKSEWSWASRQCKQAWVVCGNEPQFPTLFSVHMSQPMLISQKALLSHPTEEEMRAMCKTRLGAFVMKMQCLTLHWCNPKQAFQAITGLWMPRDRWKPAIPTVIIWFLGCLGSKSLQTFHKVIVNLLNSLRMRKREFLLMYQWNWI